MGNETIKPPLEAERGNSERGISSISIPEFGDPHLVGKIRDNWTVETGHSRYRILATSDRVSAFDRVVGTIPGKGRILNLLSEFWFEKTKDIIPNHMISVPHPNIMIAKEAKETLPVEIIVRGYMARSSTSTSVFKNYEQGRREIYGILFPDGLKPNQELPMGAIITPTTKAEKGQHDKELNDREALEVVDGQLEDGVWEKAKNAALDVFERASAICLEKGLILADTKFEFGLNEDGYLMLIDELLTPDSSRFWLAKSYDEGFQKGENPETFDKELLRRWLAEKGFKGEGDIPQIDPDIVSGMAEAYAIPFRMLAGRNLPEEDTRTTQYIELPNTRRTGFARTRVYFNRE